MIKSPIKWAGGKSWLLPKLQQLFNDSNCRNFCEPMCGSSVLSMNIECKGLKVASDINPYLINFFHQLQMGLKITVSNYKMTEEEYYDIRNKFNFDKFHHVDNACYFYYLNRAGFNGLYRENKKGEFNVPCGKRKKIKAIDDEVYMAISNIIYVNKSFEEISPFDDSFVYIDPPYHNTFTSYTPGGFSLNDFENLIKWAENTQQTYVVSNSNTPEIYDILTDYGLEIELVEAPRRIRNQPPVIEILARKKKK